MLIYNIITIACLTLMITGAVFVFVNLVTKKRKEKITYLRGFKKGKGVLIYIFAIPLYWIGLVYAGESVLKGFFYAIRRIVDLIVLKYDMSPVEALANDSKLYCVTMYVCFTVVLINAILLVLSIASQNLWSLLKRISFKLSRKEKLILFGNNEQNYSIYKSDNIRTKMLIDKISNDEALSLYMKNISNSSVNSFENYITKRVEECVKKNKTIIAIINTGDDDENVELSRYFINAINNLKDEKREKCFGLIRIFVFGDPRYESIYEDITADGLGCISYINKYQKIAIDFIDKYPFTKFMTDEHIDYNTSLVKEGVNINALMIGFGKTNQQIFLTSVANNQFITNGENGTEPKIVNYHIFDKEPKANNKNLNHNYNRYKNECENANEKDYLPLPNHPADDKFHLLDVNDCGFYNEIRKIVKSSKKDVNYIIIAFGTDLENIDMAQKLVVKTKEWGVNNLTIFVKVREQHNGQKMFNENNCFIIANENNTVYNIESIIGDRIFKMAKLRNEVYELEYEITQGENSTLTEDKIKSIKEKANYNWYGVKTQMERDSSLYCCLSLRSKLNLMGLDYCSMNCEEFEGISKDEYLSIYEQADKANRTFYSVKADGKEIIKYTLDFPDSRRKSLAIHEHLRWNSFMISKGIIPATKDQILNEKILANGKIKNTNGKNYSVRRHGNLTTFAGLEEFRKMIAERDKGQDESLEKAELRKDVIKYDYQLLDDAYWLLTKTGQKIIKVKK